MCSVKRKQHQLNNLLEYGFDGTLYYCMFIIKLTIKWLSTALQILSKEPRDPLTHRLFSDDDVITVELFLFWCHKLIST